MKQLFLTSMYGGGQNLGRRPRQYGLIGRGTDPIRPKQRIAEMKSRSLLIGIAAATLLAAPALAAPPAATTKPTVPAPAPAAGTVKPAMTRAARHRELYKTAQEKLKGMSLYSGPVDGERNASFVKSVEDFQKQHKLKVTGLLTAETQKALGI